MKKKRFLIIILLIVCAGAIIGYKIWNKPFKDPREGDAIKVTAIQLLQDFSTNETTAQQKYVPQKLGDKKVEVSGEVKEVGKNEDGETYYILKSNDEMFGVKCIMDKKETKKAKPGDAIIVRGFCDGYNLDVIVNRCKFV